jgi:dTDP-4-dehydrorhamnose reductase
MILLTGFNGKLGKELKKHLEVVDFRGDITYPIISQKCDMIIHAAAYTYVGEAEDDAKNVFETNVFGTYNLMKEYKDVPFVFISSEYANNPLGCYALSKRLGEEVVMTHPKHLIIRTLFKPNPWPFEMAYEDQFTQGDYVDVIAKRIADHINSWDKKTSEICYVGTGRKTMLELARRTKPDVVPNKITNPIIPHDYL